LVESPEWRGQIYHVEPFGDRLMRFVVWSASLLVVGAGFAAAGAVQAVRPGGPGELTKCRNWLVARACHHYHHISLPAVVAIGDTIPLSYGSNNKEYDFPVVHIALEGNRCTLFSNRNERQGDKIKIVPCYRAEEGR
jgi:hypothetical protein